MVNDVAGRCMKRRLLYACAEAYEPEGVPVARAVGWLEAPIVIRRTSEIGRSLTDQALVGRVREGVVVAIRGSLTPFAGGGQDRLAVLLDWLNDSLSICIEVPHYGGGVHLGFADAMSRLWDDAGEECDASPGIGSAIQTLLDRSATDGAARPHLFVTGHSKGGALANLAAYRAARLLAWRAVPISVATIAAPRVGNAAFARAYAAERIACLRYEISADIVPQLPPGPQTPPWLSALARRLIPRLAPGDYHPVGLRVGSERTDGSGATAWIVQLARALSLDGVAPVLGSPAALAAHTISPHSLYDRLVCTGEAHCAHR
ncbi:lipase family protein [Sphingomonas sp. RT2P30]|uniref:lipase family protein n=1 Tax=Parasphingomonas halimpatiens TaxID=3096162 RepID=UPI002FCB86A8